MPVKEPFTGLYKRDPSLNMAGLESAANRHSYRCRQALQREGLASGQKISMVITSLMRTQAAWPLPGITPLTHSPDIFSLPDSSRPRVYTYMCIYVYIYIHLYMSTVLWSMHRKINTKTLVPLVNIGLLTYSPILSWDAVSEGGLGWECRPLGSHPTFCELVGSASPLWASSLKCWLNKMLD